MPERPPGRRGLWITAAAAALATALLGHGAAPGAEPARRGPAAADPLVFSDKYPVGSRYMSVRLRGALTLRRIVYQGLALGGLSALGWDDDDGILYALSDRGRLFHLRPDLDDEGMLVDVRVDAAFPLHRHDGERLPTSWADSEGLTVLDGRDGIRGNARLAISFERHPRISIFSTRGRWLADPRLPPALGDVRRYRSPNKGLESVTAHPALGLLTAPELPLRGERYVRLARLDGGTLDYDLLNWPGSALVALEALPDGSIVALERAFQRATFSLVIALRRSAPIGLPMPTGPLELDLVAEFASNGDWAVDNFEGLARHRGRSFFLVSDDNGSLLQRTILLFLELIDSRRPGD